MQIVIDPTALLQLLMSFQEALVEMLVCATFLVDNYTGLLVTGFQDALECLYFSNYRQGKPAAFLAGLLLKCTLSLPSSCKQLEFLTSLMVMNCN